jgi:acetyltransferase-like isoleucine patch superfamily enzyme
MFRGRWQRFVQTRVWRMDIHPSARIAASALIDRTYPKGVHIGADVVIDEQVILLTHDTSRGLYLHTRIENGATIGARAIILPGVTVGRGSVVVAGALVHRDVPDGVTVLGNPAQPLAPARA